MSHEQGLEQANRQLADSGLFATLGEGGGLYGHVPIQMEGELKSGEVLTFKSRGVRVRLSIDEGDTVFLFVHEFKGVRYGYAGWLPGAQCQEFILKWIGEYRSGSFPDAGSVEIEDGCIIVRSQSEVPAGA